MCCGIARHSKSYPQMTIDDHHPSPSPSRPVLLRIATDEGVQVSSGELLDQGLSSGIILSDNGRHGHHGQAAVVNPWNDTLSAVSYSIRRCGLWSSSKCYSLWFIVNGHRPPQVEIR